MADRDHGMPDTVVTTTDELYLVNGRLVRGVELTVTEEVFEQYRLGYRCIHCQHYPQPEPMPKHCCEPYCRFPIRERQHQVLGFEDRGESDLVPDRTTGPTIDVMDDSLWLPGRDF